MAGLRFGTVFDGTGFYWTGYDGIGFDGTGFYWTGLDGTGRFLSRISTSSMESGISGGPLRYNGR